MAHDARDIANEIINRGVERHQVFTHLQIQKLVYYCHAWMLGIYGTPLITQEVAAWEYGPVIEDLYHSLKKYGKDQVQVIPRFRRATCTQEESAMIDGVLTQYGGLSGMQLSSLTHSSGSPWYQIKSENLPGDGTIPNDMIKQYYKDAYDKYVEEMDKGSQ